MEKDHFFEFMRKIPKAEIHLHLEDFIAGQGVKEETIDNLDKFISIYHSLLDSISAIEDLNIAFKRLVAYMNDNGIVYAEVFFSPIRYVRNMGFSYPDLVRYFEETLYRVKEKFNIVIKLIPDMSRTYGPEVSDKFLDMMIENPSKDIIGVGLGSAEGGFQNRDYVEVFEKARKHGLRTVAHAGESIGPDSIRDAVEILEAERIGHATSAIFDESLVEMLVAKQIPLEIQPTSNLVTGAFVKNLEDHPVREYLDRGAFITINTDDPTLFNTTLLDEYWKLYDIMDFKLRHIYHIIVNGFMASFMSNAKKRDYIRQVNRKWNRGFLLKNRDETIWQSEIMNRFKGGNDGA